MLIFLQSSFIQPICLADRPLVIIIGLLTYRVTTCLENLEMSGNLTAVKEMSGILLKIMEMSGEKSCQVKVAFFIQLWYLRCCGCP